MTVLHRGVIATNPKIIAMRPLTRDDLLCLRDKRPTHTVKTFRDSHHRLARLCAAGLRYDQICLRGGISSTRLSSLKADPAFQELISSYRDKVNAAFVEAVDNFYEVSVASMMKAETMLSDKLDAAIEAGETLPTKDLLAITSDRADRFGYPKHKTSTNTNNNVDFAAMLEATARRSGRSNVIDASPSRASIGPKAIESHATLSSAQPIGVGNPGPVLKPVPSVAGIRRRA